MTWRERFEEVIVAAVALGCLEFFTELQTSSSAQELASKTGIIVFGVIVTQMGFARYRSKRR